jgi:dCTP deaminase
MPQVNGPLKGGCRMLLNDKQILALCQMGMISPFRTESVKVCAQSGPCISYGVTSFGYDLSASEAFLIFTNANSGIVDPKKFTQDNCVPGKLRSDSSGKYVIIPPNCFALTSSVEYVKMPENIVGIAVGKSTYARCGIITNVTPLEPGWEGYVTLEISNTTNLPAKIYAHEGLVQVLFLQGNRPAVTYADRQGKYQYQIGITLPRV